MPSTPADANSSHARRTASPRTSPTSKEPTRRASTSGSSPPTGKKARTPRTAAGTVADRILTAIDAGHHTPRTIADHAGTALGTVQVTLGKMLAAGQVARDGDRGAYRWRRP